MLPSDPPPNIQAELARERNRAAAERTLMAWIRTSLSLIGFGFGFGIDRIVTVIHNFNQAANINPVRLSRVLGSQLARPSVQVGILGYSLVGRSIPHSGL